MRARRIFKSLTQKWQNIQVLKADGRVVRFSCPRKYIKQSKKRSVLSEQNEAAADHDVDAVVALVVDKLIASEAESVSTDDIRLKRRLLKWAICH